MKTSRLRRYIFLSVLVHILVLWLLRFLPPYAPTPDSPVTIRMLDIPPQAALSPAPPSVPKHPKPQRREPKKAAPKTPPKKGDVLAELPKPVRQARPEDARLVSQFDSKAQDIGPGDAGARKPSGQNPREMPPELALPERYSQLRPTPPRQTPVMPTPPAPPSPLEQPTPQLQARRLPASPPRATPKETRQPETSAGTVPVPIRKKHVPSLAPTPDLRQFPITKQQELAMVQRDHPQTEQAKKNTMEEHFARLEDRQPLLSPTFDAPGVYERGAERPGEGRGAEGGGKYRSIDAFGLKHFSYLIGVKRKIELLFSVPFFMPNNGSVGIPIIGFTIRRNGVLSEAVLLRSSGYAVLDKALLDAVRRAAPYGPFPNHLPDPEISIRVYATVS
jgi:protein TonB